VGFLIEAIIPKNAIHYQLETNIGKEYNEKEVIVDLSKIKKYRIITSRSIK